MLGTSVLHSEPPVQQKSLCKVQFEQFANGLSLKLGYYSGTSTKFLLEAACLLPHLHRDAGDMPAEQPPPLFSVSKLRAPQKHILHFFSFIKVPPQAQLIY